MQFNRASIKRKSMQRLWRALPAAAMTLMLAGCGEGYFAVGSDGFYYEGGYDYRYDVRYDNCRSVVYPAVVVEFFAAEDGGRLAVIADGDIVGGNRVERLRVDRNAGGGLVYSLAGGFDRAGIFDVSVTARRVGDTATQTFRYDNIRVDADRCGPVTVFLNATVN